MAGNPNWTKGKSGNPAGRPKDAIAPLAREKSVEAFNTLLALLKSEDENIRLKASLAIIERGFGKPIQPLEGAGDTITHITYVWNHEPNESNLESKNGSHPVLPTAASDRYTQLNGKI